MTRQIAFSGVDWEEEENEWEVVLNLQIMMIQFVIGGLYDDPVSAATDGEHTSDSSGEQRTGNKRNKLDNA